MEKLIMVRSLESFSVHYHNGTDGIGEVENGEVLLAVLHEGSGEYFARDRHGKEIYVGKIDKHDNLDLDFNFEFVQIGMTDEHKKNFLFQALASMGNASAQMSWANNSVEDIQEVPDELKVRMKQINAKIHELQDELRSIRESIHGKPIK